TFSLREPVHSVDRRVGSEPHPEPSTERTPRHMAQMPTPAAQIDVQGTFRRTRSVERQAEDESEGPHAERVPGRPPIVDQRPLAETRPAVDAAEIFRAALAQASGEHGALPGFDLQETMEAKPRPAAGAPPEPLNPTSSRPLHTAPGI